MIVVDSIHSIRYDTIRYDITVLYVIQYSIHYLSWSTRFLKPNKNLRQSESESESGTATTTATTMQWKAEGGSTKLNEWVRLNWIESHRIERLKDWTLYNIRDTYNSKTTLKKEENIIIKNNLFRSEEMWRYFFSDPIRSRTESWWLRETEAEREKR